MQLNKINCMETPKIDEYLLCKSINIKSYSKKRVLYHITILIYEIYKNDEIAIKMIKKTTNEKVNFPDCAWLLVGYLDRMFLL